MTWNWQQKDWPNFTYNSEPLQALEKEFLHNSGILFGVFKHLDVKNQQSILIDFMSDEALRTSEIEGEYLDRDSIQSSIRKEFGLQSKEGKVAPAERGVAEMMIDLYHTYASPLTHETLFRWHQMLLGSRDDLESIGRYRTHKEPMQVVSGDPVHPTIHFQAPPSERVHQEMEAYIEWFNKSETTGLSAITRASIAHLYFESIHPFEDGNGRIGRALVEKCLGQSLSYPTLIALSTQIESHRKDYYEALEQANKRNEITPWLVYFGKTILAAQRHTQEGIEFLVLKGKLLDKFRNQLNPRQEKCILRLLREGPKGFQGGLNAEKYMKITKASSSTATRDLHQLLEMGLLRKEGKRRHTRYYLVMEQA